MSIRSKSHRKVYACMSSAGSASAQYRYESNYHKKIKHEIYLICCRLFE
jgi:hypothetical protein